VATAKDLERNLAAPEFYGPEGFPIPGGPPVAALVLPKRFERDYADLASFARARYPCATNGPFLVFNLRPPPARAP
jgi:hypothetical protein